MKTRVLAFISALTALGFSTSPAPAAVSIAIQPLVAEFDAPPGTTGHAPVLITNNGNEAERIVIRRTDWRTLADGSIALEKPGAEGAHSITRDLSLSAYQFVLQPGEHRELSLTLAVPPSLPKGASYWGGLIAQASAVSAPPSAVGVAATVFAYENNGAPRRHLSLQAMRVASGRDGAKLIARIRNDAAGYCRPFAHLLVEQAGRIVRDEKITVSTVFPNSTRILTQSLGKLAPGTYRVEMTFDYSGDSILDGVTEARVR
jgi:hypothetical protein